MGAGEDRQPVGTTGPPTVKMGLRGTPGTIRGYDSIARNAIAVAGPPRCVAAV